MKSNLLVFGLILSAFLPLSAYAVDFVGLVGIPGIEPSGDTDLNEYINALYRLSISIAALLAVIKIVAAGAKYMLSDIITHKEDAKKDIQGAIIGLLIVIGAIIILNTVNSDLTRLSLGVPQTTVLQGQAIDQAIYNAVTAACDRPGRESECVTLTCESWFGIDDDVEILPGEDDVAACRRVCREDYRGAFDANLVDIDSSTCRYDPEVARNCDPNNSWNCCNEINGFTWSSPHQRCITPANPVNFLRCAGVFTGPENTDPRVCDEEIAACRESGNTVISTFIANSDDPTLPSSVMCSDREQAAENNAGQDVINNSSFSALAENYSDDALTLLSNRLGVSINTNEDIIGVNTIPASAINAAGGDSIPDSDQLERIAQSLRSRCSGSRVVYGTGTTNDNGPQFDFYCLR